MLIDRFSARSISLSQKQINKFTNQPLVPYSTPAPNTKTIIPQEVCGTVNRKAQRSIFIFLPKSCGVAWL